MKRSALGVSLASLLVAGLLVWWMMAHDVRRAPSAQAAAAAAPDSGARSARSAAANPSASAAAATVPGASASGTSRPGGRRERGPVTAARALYERSRADAGHAFQALVAAGDADSLFFAERALHDCAQLVQNGAAPGEAVPIDRYRPLPASDTTATRRQASYTALATRCAGIDLGADPAATAKSLHDALVAAQEPHVLLGEMARDLRRGGDVDTAMAKARESAASGDPYVLDEAAGMMGALRGRYVFMVDGQMMRPDVVSAAWTMAACDAGLACGAEAVQAGCAFLAECDAPDVESSLARYQMTPGDFDRMQQVRARIAQGLASGAWDPALFSPQPQPPWYRRTGP